jgi:hypothetical protein
VEAKLAAFDAVYPKDWMGHAKIVKAGHPLRFLDWLADLEVLQPDVLPSSYASPPSLHGMRAFRDKAVA